MNRFTSYNVLNYGAGPDKTAAENTQGIQAAIDVAYANGGGSVVIPMREAGVYQTQASTDTTVLGIINAGPTLASYPASQMVSLLLRSGVYLEIDPSVVLECIDPTKTVVGLHNMTGGGIVGRCHIKSVWDENAPFGAGHGLFTFYSTDPNQDPMCGLRIEGPEISHVASYGVGAQLGFMERNIYDDLYIHDTGADAFDHKARPRRSDGKVPNGIFITRLRAEKYGRRNFGSPASCCALDARGPVIVEGLQAAFFNMAGQNNCGVRLSAGLFQGAGGIDWRVPAAEAILTNFQIDGGDPAILGGYGLAMLDSGAKADNGFIKNVETGYTAEGSSSGWGSNANAQISNVLVEGSRAAAFNVNSDHVTLINCAAEGQSEAFESTKGNLTTGQTVFTSPRAFVNAAVEVYKNGTKLTVAADYTVTGTTTITLLSSVLASDLVEIVSPTATGFSIAGANVRNMNPRTRRVTVPRAISGRATGTLLETGAMDDGRPWFSEQNDVVRMNLVPTGSLTDYNLGLWAKGNAGIDLFSYGFRVARMANPQNAVNYLVFQGASAGSDPTISVQGSGVRDLVMAGFGGGSLKAYSSAWNDAHFKIGNYHLWVDGQGRLRMKNSSPAADTDGVIIGTQS